VNGLLVAERDDEGLANALIKMVQDPARWIAMGASASKTVEAEFAQPRQVESLESVYFEVMESPKGKKGTE
jgi:glycosyltransferase involved in cell wall biosynthesis